MKVPLKLNLGKPLRILGKFMDESRKTQYVVIL